MKIIITVLSVGFALFVNAQELGAETGFDLAPELRGLESSNPEAHRVLRDGTFDTMHPDEKVAFAAERWTEAFEQNRLATEAAGKMVRELQGVREGNLPPKAQATIDEAISRAMLMLIDAVDGVQRGELSAVEPDQGNEAQR